MTTVGRWYEIRLVGRLGPALRLAFPGLESTVEPRHYVLLVPAGGGDLFAVLARPGLRHVEVVRAQLRATPPLTEVMPPATTREVTPAAVGASSPGGIPSCNGVPVTDHQWEIHVSGVLPKSVLDAELAGLVMAVQPATTVLSGPLRDEAELRGVLDRMQSLGLRLVEVRQLPELAAAESDTPPEGSDEATALPRGSDKGIAG